MMVNLWGRFCHGNCASNIQNNLCIVKNLNGLKKKFWVFFQIYFCSVFFDRLLHFLGGFSFQEEIYIIYRGIDNILGIISCLSVKEVHNILKKVKFMTIHSPGRCFFGGGGTIRSQSENIHLNICRKNPQSISWKYNNANWVKCLRKVKQIKCVDLFKSSMWMMTSRRNADEFIWVRKDPNFL